MHLGNGALTLECVAVTGIAAGASMVVAGSTLRRHPPARAKCLLALGGVGALLALQAVNFPVASGVSGHVLGGVALAALVGPELAMLAVSLVLAIQAFVLGDGGVLALGANGLNMAIVPTLLWKLAQDKNLAFIRDTHTKAGLVATTSVLVACGLIGLETLPTLGAGQAARFVGALLTNHLPIALAEGFATSILVWTLSPIANAYIVEKSTKTSMVGWGLRAATGVALAIALFSLASDSPDGLEAAAKSISFTGM